MLKIPPVAINAITEIRETISSSSIRPLISYDFNRFLAIIKVYMIKPKAINLWILKMIVP